MTRAAHPAAEVWPLLPEDELQALADDIEANGLRDPITVDEKGRIIDGRNRLAACDLAEVEPRFEIFEGDPVALVLSRNNFRRHISKGQRAMAAWMTAAMNNDYSQRRIANESNTSQGMVMMSKAVAEYAPDIVPNVINGDRSLKDAYDAARQRKADAESVDTKLAKLDQDHPDLAAKVRADELTLAGAEQEGRERVNQWGQMIRGAEQAAQRVDIDFLADINSIVIAVLAPGNNDSPWAIPPDLDLSHLTNRVREALNKLEDCQ